MMQRLLAATKRQRQASQQRVLQLKNQQTANLQSLRNDIQQNQHPGQHSVVSSKILHLRDLPNYASFSYEFQLISFCVLKPSAELHT